MKSLTVIVLETNEALATVTVNGGKPILRVLTPRYKKEVEEFLTPMLEEGVLRPANRFPNANPHVNNTAFQFCKPTDPDFLAFLLVQIREEEYKVDGKTVTAIESQE